MKTVLLTCSFVAFTLTVAGAPTYTASEEDQVLRQTIEDYPYYREARSQYSSPHYITPCAAAAAAAGSQIHAYAAPYHLNVPSYAHYGYGSPHYRSVDAQLAEQEMLAFSDMDQHHLRHAMMDHLPIARSGYGAPISSSLALNGPALTSASGSAYGIFPNANVGGCNIPLLFSCAPSISSGHLVESQGHYPSGLSSSLGGAAASSYRLVDEQPLHDMHELSEEAVEENMEPVHETSHVHQTHM